MELGASETNLGEEEKYVLRRRSMLLNSDDEHLRTDYIGI